MSSSSDFPVEFSWEYDLILNPEESFSISWREDKLTYRQGLSVAIEDDIYPSEDDWGRFWKSVDEIGVWEWNDEYSICSQEGTRWQISLEYDDLEIHSVGLNNYPDTFPDFILALEELISRELKIIH
jgi:hypothetical protein